MNKTFKTIIKVLVLVIVGIFLAILSGFNQNTHNFVNAIFGIIVVYWYIWIVIIILIAILYQLIKLNNKK